MSSIKEQVQKMVDEGEELKPEEVIPPYFIQSEYSSAT
jgi:hypothetical protein